MTTLPLVYVTCGRGRRVAHLDHVDAVTGYFWAQVWIDAAHRWSATELVRPSRILGPVDRRDPVAKRAIRAATPGRPRCRHQDHAGAVS